MVLVELSLGQGGPSSSSLLVIAMVNLPDRLDYFSRPSRLREYDEGSESSDCKSMATRALLLDGPTFQALVNGPSNRWV